ncbi:MAG TPA: MFS transporter [Candidatus Corynebacterium avicola]|uniref:MFS transporter n=1 Tax=Candidatus Corynebacterium avicola TaxID=2838527 RepID=A0A9D1UMK4_9CORY|nr:MFS transporter [Candidatus Corynebacterium avicola]
MGQITQNSRGTRDARAWMFVVFAVFTVAWGGNEATPMLVFYRQEAVFSDVFVDSLLVSYAVGIVAGLLICGPLSDRYGRKAVMLPAPVIALLGSVFIAVGETTESIMFIGRILAGLAVGIAMSVGGSWIKELSTPAFDPKAKPASGAKRATMSLTAGFGLGAGLAGVLAEWGPIPGQLPYLVHSLLSVIAVAGLLTVPETRQSAHLKVKGSFWSDLLVPTIRHPRFLTVVAPIAPWVFGAAGVSYAIMPRLVQDQVGAPVAFSAMLTMICLASGFAIQQVGPQINTEHNARGPIVGLLLVIVGMAIAAAAATNIAVWNTIIVAIVLGAAYGLCLISGLTEVQRIAGPDDLAGLTAAYYTLTYIGFFFPMILTRANDWFSYPVMLGAGIVVAVVFLVIVAAFSRKNLPGEAAAS